MRYLQGSSNSVYKGELCGNGRKEKPQNARPKRPKSPLAGFSAKPAEIKSLQPKDINVVLFRSDCMDAKAAAYAAYVCLGKAAEYYPVKHGSAPPYALLRNKKVILLNYCYELRAMAEILLVTRGEFLMIDYHATTLKMLKKYP